MRFVFSLALLCGCYHVAINEPVHRHPVTAEEGCIQNEILCIDDSAGGSASWNFLFFVFRFTRTISGSEIVRSCQLQGELCRERAKQTEKTERAARQNLPMQIED